MFAKHFSKSFWINETLDKNIEAGNLFAIHYVFEPCSLIFYCVADLKEWCNLYCTISTFPEKYLNEYVDFKRYSKKNFNFIRARVM